MGKPKYLSREEVLRIPVTDTMVLIFERVTTLEKKALDLEILTFNPEAPTNLVKMSSITRAWETVALEKKQHIIREKEMRQGRTISR